MDDSLSVESFLRGAEKAAFKAMDDHGRHEYDEFALHGGVAVERLAKAVLARRSPLYLVEMRKGPADMLLYFGGHLEMQLEKVRTVGAGEALQRLRRIGVLPPNADLDRLIELRNGTAHTTVGDEARDLLPTLAETVALLLEDVGVGFEQFWGRWSSAVHVAIDRRRNEVERDVEIRIKQARHLFDDRFYGLPAVAKEQALRASALDVNFAFEERLIGSDAEIAALTLETQCPACGGLARLLYVSVSTSATTGTAVPDSLACGLCSLELTGPEELHAAGADVERARVPVTVSFAYERQPSSTSFSPIHKG
ncbi:hypothetical protein BCL80_11936 [Streptomyces avidinii]|uniref:hypothetical protein n=1 Tax=Streptomyces TaxID=1883 RepID=UPI000BCCE0C6|nr:hypothetical protein BCL80_11936 [Streptomyces avidinii]SNX81138.1 hypothetical protein SAMN05421860_11737 [Streptomyces microflavus]